MVFPGWQIHQEFTATLPRLTAAAYLVCIVLAVPASRVAAFARVRRKTEV